MVKSVRLRRTARGGSKSTSDSRTERLAVARFLHAIRVPIDGASAHVVSEHLIENLRDVCETARRLQAH
jgi:hypothetical protein